MNMDEIKIPLQSVKKTIGFENIPSTQTLAKELALQGEEEGTLVLAVRQSAARGRYERVFSAEDGGVYFTLILRPNKSAEANALLSRRVGQAVAETLSEAYGIKTKIKEPNDVLAWDAKTRKWKKICGILIESSLAGEKQNYLLIGVGINVNNRLPSSLKDSAVTLKQLIGAETIKEVVLEETLERFWKHYACWLLS